MKTDIANIEEIDHGPVTLMNASDRADKHLILAQVTGFVNRPGNINASDIYTKLIQYAGRYCDSYASDIICTIKSIEPFLTLPSDKPGRWVIGAGFREMGVDHNPFIMSRIKASRGGLYNYVHPEYEYRRILVLDINDMEEYGDMKRTMILKDITHSIIEIAPEDETDNC